MWNKFKGFDQWSGKTKVQRKHVRDWKVADNFGQGGVFNRLEGIRLISF